MKNRRSILVLLAGVLLLAFAHVALQSYDVGSRVERRRTLVERRDDVCVLKIERRGGVVEIRKSDESGWNIVAPFSGRADGQVIARLLDILSLASVSDVVSDGELLRLGRVRADFSLAEPPVRISLVAASGTDTVSFGALTPSADGVYAAVEGVGAVFVVPAETLSAVDRPVSAFRRRTLFSAAPESISSFVLRQGQGSSLLFTRENDGWKVDGELASKVRVEEFLSALLAAEAADFVWPVGVSNETERISASLLAGYGLEPENAVTVTLKGFDDEDRQLSLGRSAAPGKVYASVQNGSAVVTVKESLKAAALQKKTAFADFRLFPVSESSVTVIRLVDGGCSCVLTRSGDGMWRLESPVSALAEPAVVRRVLARILALPTSAAQNVPQGLSVSLSAESETVCVSRDLVLADDRMEDFRSLEMVRVDPKEVKRIVRTPGEKGGRSVSVVRSREDGTWTLESTDERSVVRPKGIVSVLESLNPLVAKRVEKLKVSAADLDGYGLGVPFLTVAVDLDRENAVRRNVLVGAKTKGGRYATVGSADAVFVISEETVERLSEQPVEE